MNVITKTLQLADGRTITIETGKDERNYKDPSIG